MTKPPDDSDVPNDEPSDAPMTQAMREQIEYEATHPNWFPLDEFLRLTFPPTPEGQVVEPLPITEISREDYCDELTRAKKPSTE